MATQPLLNSILGPEGLSLLVQGVFDVGHGVQPLRFHSFECLSQGPKGTNLESTDVLFAYVQRKQKESLVDRACTQLAFNEISRLLWLPDFSIRIHATTIGKDPDLLPFLLKTAETHSLSLSRLIVEIVEHSPRWHVASFLDTLEGLRKIGVRIALNDIGFGQSNFRMILDCQPDFFKIGQHFIKGVQWDPYRQAILDSVSYLARKVNAKVVAEGVEKMDDLTMLTGLGIHLIQGPLFSQPLPISEVTHRETGFYSVPQTVSTHSQSFESQRNTL